MPILLGSPGTSRVRMRRSLPCGANAHFSIIIAYISARKVRIGNENNGARLMMLSCSRGKSPAQLFRYLSAKWPAAFNPKAPRPLKIGIHHDIRVLDGELSDDELRRALLAYTKMAKYLARLDAGAARVNLDGKPAGVVSDADAATAKALLCSRKDKQKGKQTPEPRVEPQAPPKPKPKRTAVFKAKNTADSPTGIIVETKRRRSFRKPMT
ncbi:MULTISPECIES: ProQ/FINO family protein [unclassified Mesorhizobium]|uniref:ProQ/FINO family protein n=1 Tax=unclassified Mesorhizobium TaxID=325217 RepID=UPI001FD12F6E|nr:ProQ/FinO family protein [Mesorhizobium sp. 131-3-5]